jgi:hypothetical protein
MGTRADTDTAGPGIGLAGLDDAAFFAYWAATRTRLSLTPVTSPGHCAIKAEYDAALAEYRRRMNGATE